MTRRLTISILATLWAILIAGGVVAYFTTRSILVEDMDHTLVLQALAQAKQHRPTEFADIPMSTDARGYSIDVRRPFSPDRSIPAPEILHKAFTSNGQRTMTVLCYGSNGVSSREVVSLSTDRFNDYMNTLLLALGGFIVVTGVVVAGVATVIARLALKPLVRTAETIGAIDARSLDRRIQVKDLPQELRPMALRLNEMLTRLDISFANRKQFLADASHELRTPVAALVTSLEVSLSRPRSAGQYHDVLQQALQDALFLQQLSEGLLEEVRSERGRSTPLEEVNISELLTGCCELLKPLADEHHVTIVQEIAPGMHDTLDDRRLRSIIMNLMSNAVDYNRPGGTVTLKAGLLRTAESATLEIVVKDTGIGIAPEHLKGIFEPFYRVDSTRTGGEALPPSSPQITPFHAPHLGLGLSLVQRHVEAMGGLIGVRSKINKGTEFTIVLPVTEAFRDNHTNAKLTPATAHAALIKPNRIAV